MDFSQIAVLLIIAAVFGIAVKRVNQPVFIGYIIAGFLLSLGGILKSNDLILMLGKVGVTLLLFLIGLEMNLKDIRSIGKAALLTGLGQVLLTFLAAYILGLVVGFNSITAVFIAIAVSFSSTIVIVKLLSEKHTLNTLHGKIILGYLLIQDVIAIAILITLTGLAGGKLGIYDYLWMIYKAVLLFLVIWFLSKKILPYLFNKYVAGSQDLLFIVSIAWALGLAALVAGPLGFTPEIGGFLAGLALTNLPEHLEIASKTRSLRDFFLTLFFLNLGASIKMGAVHNIIFPAILFILLIIFIKPAIVMLIMGFLRFKKRTSFLSAIVSPQISEFSLILVATGVSLGHINADYLTLTVILAIVTMTASTYLIMGGEKTYNKIKGRLEIFERKNLNDLKTSESEVNHNHIVLIGCLRTGPRLVSYFKAKKWRYVIIDFSPTVYQRLLEKNEPAIFGDITDTEVLRKVNMEKAKLIISTVDSLNDNLTLLEYVAKLSPRPQTVFTSGSRTDAIKLYQNGAGYVVVPDIVAGDYIRHLMKSYGIETNRLTNIGKKHFQRLTFT